MKKIQFFLAALSACILTIACQKETPAQIPDDNDDATSAVDIPAEEPLVFSAVTEGPTTKTEMSDNGDDTYTVIWKNGDAINVNGYNLNLQTSEQPDGYGPGYTRGNFAGPINPAAGGTSPKYKALYPSSIFGTPGSLPTEQSYVADNIGNFPMYAESDTPSFNFHNLCGIIRIGLKGCTRSIVSIALNDVDDTPKPLSGPFTVSSNMAVITSGTNGTSLVCPTPVTLSNDAFTYFHISVPAATYGKLRISITDSDGEIWTLTAKSFIEVERSMITPINLSSPNFVNPSARILYTTTDGNALSVFTTGSSATLLGDDLTVVSHTYTNGQGVIILSGTVTKIGNNAFQSQNNLQTITLPETVTSIGTNAFNGDRYMTACNFPASLTTIGSQAFQGCLAFDPKGQLEHITSYGGLSFNNTALSGDLIIGTGVTRVDNYAFKNSQITSVTFEHTPTNFGNYVFQDCSSLESATFEEAVNIPQNTFDGCSSLEEVVFGSTCGTIGARAFWHCSALTAISDLSSVTSIGERAFSGTGFTSLPSGLNRTGITFGQYMFEGSALSSADISTWTAVPAYCFMNCASLASVTLGSSLTVINDFAFNGCSSLETVSLPASVTQIKQRAFQDSGLTALPSGLHDGITLGNYVFSGTNLTAVTLPDALTTLGSSNYTFSNCTSLTEFHPNKVTVIREGCFSGCISLSNFDFNDITSIGVSSFDKTAFTSISLPLITAIPSNAFNSCSSLASVSLPNVQTLASRAFWSCTSLTDISLPSIVSVDNQSFGYCSNLSTVDYGASVTSIAYNPFHGVSSITSLIVRATSVPTLGGILCVSGSFNGTIYVPAASVDDYKAATNWSTYADKIEAIP